MNDKQKLNNLIQKMIENNKKQIQKAESKGDFEREYFHEGSLTALEAIMLELQK